MTRLLRDRHARHCGAGQAGVTLVETMMVMALLGIVLAAAGGVLSSYQRTAKGADLRLENLTEAEAIVDRVSKDIRTATRPKPDTSPFVSANATDVVFFANLDTTTGPKLIHLYVDPTTKQVFEEAQEPKAGGGPPWDAVTSYAGQPKVVRVVGRHFANPASQKLLTYLDDEGDEIPGTPIATADLLRIDAVRINLSIRKSTSLSVAPTTVRTTVRLPNVDYQPISES